MFDNLLEYVFSIGLAEFMPTTADTPMPTTANTPEISKLYFSMSPVLDILYSNNYSVYG